VSCILTYKGFENNDVRNLGARRAVAQMERAELEDKHLSLMEENLVNILLVETAMILIHLQLLKKHIKSQEEKMKRYG